MALHALKDGSAANVRPVSEGATHFHALLHTHLTPQQYGAMVSFLESCEDPTWGVSQKSALAQVSLDVRVPHHKAFTSLKYRDEKLKIPARIALESVYARKHFREVIPDILNGWDIGRVYGYDRSAALGIHEIDDLYYLPKGTQVLSDTEVALPMEDLHYVIHEEGLRCPEEALYYALEGRRQLKHVLGVRHGPLPALAPNDTLISAFTLESKTDRVPPTNVVLGIHTTRRQVDHLHAPLLDEGRLDVHNGSSAMHKTCFQVELVNRSNRTLDPEEVKNTLVKARFYRSVDGMTLHTGDEAQMHAVS